MYGASEKVDGRRIAEDLADAIAERIFWRLKLIEYAKEIESEEGDGELQPLSEFLKENSP